jgi:hypothetical protein
MRKICLWQIAQEAVLAGANKGKATFAELIKCLPKEPIEPEALFIDFLGVEIATASFLRESVFSLKSYLRRTNSRYYPVVCNVNTDTWDELSVIAQAMGDVLVCCKLDKNGVVSEQEIIGSLDPKQKMTFDLVQELRQADAVSLMREFGEAEQTKTTTAWNNRLVALADKGILREFSRGRAKFYRPLFDGDS